MTNDELREALIELADLMRNHVFLVDAHELLVTPPPGGVAAHFDRFIEQLKEDR